jgi:hypothetical protein
VHRVAEDVHKIEARETADDALHLARRPATRLGSSSCEKKRKRTSLGRGNVQVLWRAYLLVPNLGLRMGVVVVLSSSCGRE